MADWQEIALLSGGVAMAPHALTYLTDFVVWCVSRGTKDEGEIERMVKEESKKLGIGDIVFANKMPGYFARAGRFGYHTKEDRIVSSDEIGRNIAPIGVIEWGDKLGLSRHTIRHELYHIARHLPNKTKNPFLRWLQYFAYHEPAAIVYSLTGLKV